MNAGIILSRDPGHTILILKRDPLCVFFSSEHAGMKVLPQGWRFALASVVLMYTHEESRNGRNQIVLELRGYAGESDASLDSGCRVRNGKAQLPNHVNLPSVTVLGIVEYVVARTSLLSHHPTSATTAKRIEHIEHQH